MLIELHFFLNTLHRQTLQLVSGDHYVIYGHERHNVNATFEFSIIDVCFPTIELLQACSQDICRLARFVKGWPASHNCSDCCSLINIGGKGTNFVENGTYLESDRCDSD